jgi:glycerophosphoryl diester phosphodiesterase
MRGGGTPLLLDELAGLVGAARNHPSASVQLDLKGASAREIDGDVATAFAAALAGPGARFILSGGDWEAVMRLGGAVDGLALGYDPIDDAGVDVDADTLERLIRAIAPDAHTIYLHRECVRASQARGDGLVARLKAWGHRIDCWTIDFADADADADLGCAVAAGCDAITTNTAIA